MITQFTSKQHATLTGTLLGDGCLAQHGHYHRLHIKHKDAHRALALFKYEVFRDFISMPPHGFDQRLGEGRYPCVQFATRTHSLFSDWHARFYRERRKIVPVDIADDLSPLALAVWLMDDGAADRTGVTFQTHSFERAESERLCEALEEKLGIQASLRRNKGSWIIYVGIGSLERLRTVVQPWILPEFHYKLQTRKVYPAEKRASKQTP